MANRIAYANQAYAGNLVGGSGAMVGGGGAAFTPIVAPKVIGTGLIAAITQAALGQTTAAANAWGQAHAPAPAAGGGGAIGPSGGSAVAGLLRGYPELRGTVRSLAGALMTQYPSLRVTSTISGTHADHSDHYVGHAVDLAADQGTMDAAGAWAQRNLGTSTKQGIHNPTFSINQGKAVGPGFWGLPRGRGTSITSISRATTTADASHGSARVRTSSPVARR